MVENENETMEELYRSHGYDTDTLVHPKDVDVDDIDEDSLVVAYTVVRNPDPDAPATTWDVREYEIDDVVPTDEVSEYTDGAVSYPDGTPVTHGVVWAYRQGDVPKFASIGYGDELYGEDSDMDDPQRWDRLVSNVLGLSDDFIRFKL